MIPSTGQKQLFLAQSKVAFELSAVLHIIVFLLEFWLIELVQASFAGIRKPWLYPCDRYLFCISESQSASKARELGSKEFLIDEKTVIYIFWGKFFYEIT